MNYIRLIILLLFFSTTVFGKQKIDSTKQNKTISAQTQSQVNLNLPSILQIQRISDKQDNLSFFEKHFVSFIALIIGIISAIVNLCVARRLRYSNERNLQKLIENAKETTMREFNATINTHNRQEWINELRHTLSQLLSYTTQILPPLEDTYGKSIDKNAFVEKIAYSKAKIDLLTNEEKPEQKTLLDAVDRIIDTSTKNKEEFNMSDFQDAREKMIQASRKLFRVHWLKIKDLK